MVKIGEYRVDWYVWPFGLVAMIPALGAGGPGFNSRNGPYFLLSYQENFIFN